jgi:membrane protease YdiL (CAAX protease family)
MRNPTISRFGATDRILSGPQPGAGGRDAHDLRFVPRTFVLAPIVLILATLAVFNVALSLAGARLAHLIGFTFYWVFGGVVLPLALIGRDGFAVLFAQRPVRWSIPLAIMLVLLALPVAFGFLFVFPSLFPVDRNVILLGVAAYALVNGTLEEVFWRGVFARRFPSNVWMGVLYPALMFALWQLVPWSVFPTWPVMPALAVFAVALPVGLIYNWVAWRTGSIRWTVLSHVLTNLSGIGALLIFAPG